MAKQKIMLSLSRVQRDNGIKKMLDNITEMNARIDQRCAAGEEVSPKDPSIVSVQKMRSMLALMANS